jgi:hypothetical protein
MRRTMGLLAARLSDRRAQALMVAGVALAGVVLRIAWVLADQRLRPTNSEMFYVARAFAETGRLADAYGPGSGPTAHVAPVMPILVGGIYRIFGVGTPMAESVLISLSLACVAIALFAANRALAKLDVSWTARLAGFAAFVLIPLNFSLEMQAQRVWEGAVAAAALMAVLAWVVELDSRPGPPSWLQLAALAAAGGLIAMLSPAAALGAYACLGLLALRRRGFLALGGATALSVVLLLAVAYPWASRNEAVLGERVWSRTNFGFNFALGFHDGAVNPADPRRAFLERLEEVDPYSSPQALAALKVSGGEQAYSQAWTQRTDAWIATHPAAAAKIAARHLGEYFFPPAWQWNVYSEKSKAVGLKQFITWLCAALAALGLAWRLLGRDWRYFYVLAALAAPASLYVLAQPILRYRYLAAALIMYLAADAGWRLAAAAFSKRAPGPSITDDRAAASRKGVG